MKIGDLVTHKYNGGVGIITDSRFGHSNIKLGTTEWVIIKWIEQGENLNRSRYIPAYLELVEPTDKKVNNFS